MIQKIGNKTGAFFFMKPNILNNPAFIISDKKDRKSDFYLSPNTFENEEVDSISFQIPKIFMPDKLPTFVSISTPFGAYESTVIFKEGVLWYYRKLILHSGCFSAKEYTAYKDFCKIVNKNDNQQIAFKIVNN